MARTISFSDVEKRRMCLESVLSEKHRSIANEYTNAFNAVRNEREDAKERIHEFFSICKRSNDPLPDLCFKFLSLTEGTQLADTAIYEIKEIIPYIENTSEVKNLINESEVSQETKDILLDEVYVNQVCDRVLNNAHAISKRFNLEQFINDRRYAPLEDIVMETCNLIDTYKLPPHGKLNITIEMMTCLFEKCGKQYDQDELVHEIHEYYLLNNKTDKETLAKFNKVLTENRFIDKAKEKIKKHDEEHKNDPANKVTSTADDLEKIIKEFEEDETKDMSKLDKALYKFFRTNPRAIIDETPTVFGLLRKCAIFGIGSTGAINGIVAKIANTFIEKKANDDSTKELLKRFKSELKSVDKKLDKMSDGEKKTNLEQYKKSLEMGIKRLENYRENQYDDYGDDDDEDEDDFLENASASIIPIMTNEFYATRFQKLVENAKIAKSYFNRQTIRESLEKDMAVVYDVDLKQNMDIVKEGFVSEKDFFHCPLIVYEWITDNKMEANRILYEACKTMNDIYFASDTCHVHCKKLNEDQIGVYLSDATPITLTEQEKRILSEGFDPNNLKLMMAGIKKKMSSLSAKQQELCRNLDACVNNLASSIKQALVSDRREAIIKGSVIPSFSKGIKLCIPLAGITAFNPALGLITALGGLAMSKSLTERERSLLLDEIDIELKVVSKEIQKAEDKGDTKNYRKLLTYQKKLQREHQRIKYRLKGGNKNLPDISSDD